MITLEQTCSRLAWERLTNRFGNNPSQWQGNENAKKYLSALKKTPARIHSCGLGQAIAFLNSRTEVPAVHAGADLSSVTLSLLDSQERDLISLIRNCRSATFFLATDEATRAIIWLTRYLEGAGVRSLDNEDGDAGEEA